ncbi:MAG: alpha-mannosidase, partial [Muribaculaceae bacterium]|nr:alpha-mannosidase [Muribaculaceae bacterium]
MRVVACAVLLVSLLVAVAQDVYFVDGYHGGIYGHYPVEWKTRFIVDQLKANPDWRIGLEIEPETWDTVKVKTPIDYADFKRMVSTGRQIEFTNPTYAQPYCYNISGESIIRQFKYGIEKIKKHFPSVEFTTYAVEEPCFTSCLPQLLSQFGFKYASLKCPNTCWGGYVSAYGGELINWIGSDGTSMLSVPRYECEDFEKNSTWQTIAWRSQRKFWNACFDMGIKHPVGMCYQDAGWKGGPWLGRRNQAKYVTWTDYIENVTSGKSDDDWHFSQEDVRVSLMWGSQVLQRIGRQVRRAENAMVVAEKMSAIAFVSDGYHMRQTRIDEGWRTLMLAQHHDSWIVPYNGLNERGTWAQNIKCWTDTTISIANAEKLRAAEMFGQTTGAARYIKVFNTSGSARRDVVEVSCFGEDISKSIKLVDADGLSADGVIEEGILRFVADVPAFGYNTYRLAESDGRPIAKSHVYGNIVETDYYKIEFDLNRGGVISSFISKRDGNKELIDVNNRLSFGELRGFFYDLGRFCSSTESPAEMTVVRDNGIDVKVCIKGN